MLYYILYTIYCKVVFFIFIYTVYPECSPAKVWNITKKFPEVLTGEWASYEVGQHKWT